MSPKDFARTKACIKKIENIDQRKLIAAPQRRRRGGGFGAIVPAQSPSGGVTGGTLSAPTSFSATFLVAASGNGMSAGSTTVTAYHHYTEAIGASKLVWLVMTLGQWRSLDWEC